MPCWASDSKVSLIGADVNLWPGSLACLAACNAPRMEYPICSRDIPFPRGMPAAGILGAAPAPAGAPMSEAALPYCALAFAMSLCGFAPLPNDGPTM